MLLREFAKITTHPTLFLSAEEGHCACDTGVIQSEELVLAAAVEVGYSRANLLAWQMTCIHCQLLHRRGQHSPVTRLGCLTESFSWHISVGFLNYWFCKPENFVYISQQTIAFSLQNSTSIKVCGLLLTSLAGKASSLILFCLFFESFLAFLNNNNNNNKK